MMKRNLFQKNNSGIISILEMVIATAIIFTVVGLFYTSVNNLIGIYVRSDVDLKAKCLDVCEVLTRTPGLSNDLARNWEDKTGLPSQIGLAATPTLSYGTFHFSLADPNTPIPDTPPLYQHFFDTPYGNVISSCFLAGTQVATPDGTFKAIETIHVGDVVMSLDRETNKVVPRTVVNVLHHTPDEMTDYYLVLNGFLKVTPNHLFYDTGIWHSFGQITVGSIIHGVPIFSVEKVYKKVPTFDLTVEHDHNYLVRFSNNPIVVHNTDPVVDSSLWLPASKNAIINEKDFETFGFNYYVEYTLYPLDHSQGGIYEVKGENAFPYAVLDANKIDKLKTLPYSDIKNILGFKEDTSYQFYDFSIDITSLYYFGSKSYTYGASYESRDTIVSIRRNILIYHPPTYGTSPTDIIQPFYEGGQITISLYK